MQNLKKSVAVAAMLILVLAGLAKAKKEVDVWNHASSLSWKIDQFAASSARQGASMALAQGRSHITEADYIRLDERHRQIGRTRGILVLTDNTYENILWDVCRAIEHKVERDDIERARREKRFFHRDRSDIVRAIQSTPYRRIMDLHQTIGRLHSLSWRLDEKVETAEEIAEVRAEFLARRAEIENLLSQ